jgi:uncharacterized protein
MVTVRGLVSSEEDCLILLAELVKIDAKSIGVGQYQHDVDQKINWKEEQIRLSCVAYVGININTVSKSLFMFLNYEKWQKILSHF